MGSSCLSPSWKFPFFQFVNINYLLVMHRIRYIFNKTWFKAYLTSICEGFMTLQARYPLMDVAAKRFQVLGKFCRRGSDDSYDGFIQISMPSDLDSGILLPVLLIRFPTKFIFFNYSHRSRHHLVHSHVGFWDVWQCQCLNIGPRHAHSCPTVDDWRPPRLRRPVRPIRVRETSHVPKSSQWRYQVGLPYFHGPS